MNEIEEREDVAALVGSKAHNLARLTRTGFPVPPGFCLTTDAYRHHLTANNLTHEIESLLAHPDLSDDEKAHLAQQAIADANLPQNLHEAVVKAYRLLSNGDPLLPLAVRSSTTAEDAAGASFAGQHDTFLDVRGELALIESIKRCWASLWTPRSQSYRAQLRPDDASAAMAVVVQYMVPADRSGVAFTVDPVTGADEIVVEATPGLGERLVSGLVTPDHYRVDKQTREIRSASPARSDREILSTAHLQQVARLAAEVERHFGEPQDVEWAQANGHTYLLQSRPVTSLALPELTPGDSQVDLDALRRRADETGSEIWTDDNVGEVLPGVVTPLTWSVLEPLGNGAFRSFLRRVGVRRYPAAGLFGRFHGRVYFNQSQFQRLMRRFYPSHLGQIGRRRSRLLGLLYAALALVETGLRALFLIPTLPRHAEWLMKAIPTKLKGAPAPKTLTERELWTEIERWRQIGQQAMSVHLAVTIFATLLHSLLDKLVPHWSAGTIETAHLLAGLPGIKSAGMGRDLAALAAVAAVDTDLRDCLLDGPPEALTDCVSNLPPDNHFARQLGEFLSKHGHASLREFELAFPRWREDVGYVLTMLQNHLGTRHDGCPVPSPETQQVVRQRATQALRQRLRIGPRRLFFEILLRSVQRYSVARENMKYTFVMAHGHLRDLFLALADHFVERGGLIKSADLFYLTRDEITSFLSGHTSADKIARDVERHRSEERHQDARTIPPKIIEQRPDGSLHAVMSSWHSARLDVTDDAKLRGVAASPGQVTGRARVILDPQDSAHLAHGEILVTPSTNPAWAPLMLNASALVTEIGGLLSHGAIIAREYGLPTVLNVKGATQVIRTGQLVAVDGSAGTVSVLDET